MKMNMVKRILKISGIVVATILLCYFFYGSYIFLQPRFEVMHFASGIRRIGTWSDEYIHNGAWTATNGSRHIYKTIDTTLLDPSTYNADCECYQWKKHIQQHWYSISVCPEYKMIFINRYFHGILDIMEERRIAKIMQQTPKNVEDEKLQNWIHNVTKDDTIPCFHSADTCIVGDINKTVFENKYFKSYMQYICSEGCRDNTYYHTFCQDERKEIGFSSQLCSSSMERKIMA